MLLIVKKIVKLTFLINSELIFNKNYVGSHDYVRSHDYVGSDVFLLPFNQKKTEISIS